MQHKKTCTAVTAYAHSGCLILALLKLLELMTRRYAAWQMLSTQMQGQYVCKCLHTEQTDLFMPLSQCHMTQHQIRIGVRDTSFASL